MKKIEVEVATRLLCGIRDQASTLQGFLKQMSGSHYTSDAERQVGCIISDAEQAMSALARERIEE